MDSPSPPPGNSACPTMSTHHVSSSGGPSSNGVSSSGHHKAHHLQEFGEVEKLVHISHDDPTDQQDSIPAPHISKKDKIARKERGRRLKKRLFMERHLMQYFYNDTLFRTEGNRKVGPDELFLDLVIVGGVAALGHELRETFSGWEDIEKFFLLFTALFSAWRSIVFLWNFFDVKSDLFDKFGIYLVFFSLTGIALGAHGAFDEGIRPWVAGCAFAATAIPAGTVIIWSFREPLMRNPQNIVNHLALMGSISIFNVTPYLAAAFVKPPRATRILFWASYGLQVVSIFFTGSLYRWLHRNRKEYTRLAVAIELFVEKFEILTMIVLGESVLGILFEAALLITKDGARVAAMYGAAACATAMLYALQTLYVNVDGQIGKGGTHAIRYKGIFGIAWGQLHTLYHMALILFATGLGFSFRDIAIPPKAEGVARFAVNALVHATTGEGEKETGARFGGSERWVFSAGWGAAIILSGMLSALHDGGPRAATKTYRLLIRAIVAIGVMVGMPFADVAAETFLVVYTVVLVVIALVEFVCVHMDRMGFFRSEDTVFSGSTDFLEDSRDTLTDDEEGDEEEEIAHRDEENLGEELTDDAAKKLMLDQALKKRLRRRHCNRLIAVKLGAKRDVEEQETTGS